VPISALLLVLGAAVCHTTWNVLLKRAASPLHSQASALAWGVVVASPVLFVYSLPDVPAAGWAAIAVSALFEAGYVFALTSAYGAGDLSVVYPVARGSASLIVVPVAIAVLGERPSAAGLLGIALVLAGVLGADGSLFRRGPFVPGRQRAIALALLTGSMTAGYSLANKIGVGLVPVPLYAYLVFALSVVLVFAAMRASGRHAGVRHDGLTARTAVMGVLMLAAYGAVLTAMSLAPVSYVVAAREVGVVVAALLGTLLLHEPHSHRRVAAAAIIFAGLVLIALSR
jgi:drug/metabolite transporter (DMT)-like permease